MIIRQKQNGIVNINHQNPFKDKRSLFSLYAIIFPYLHLKGTSARIPVV